MAGFERGVAASHALPECLRAPADKQQMPAGLLSLFLSPSLTLSLSLVQMEKTHAYTHTLSLYLLSLLLYFCPSPLPSQDLKIHSGGNTREIHLKQRGKEEDRGERVRVSEGGK